ncbi:hypothetical protein GCM10027431_08290 [Lysobacter rhizosphaerae]
MRIALISLPLALLGALTAAFAASAAQATAQAAPAPAPTDARTAEIPLTPERVAVWGVLAFLADSSWGKSTEPTSIGTLHVVDRFKWINGGTAMQLDRNTFGMTERWIIRPGKVRGELAVEITSPFGVRKTTLRPLNAYSFATDWYSLGRKNAARSGYALNSSADRLLRLDAVTQDGSRPEFAPVTEQAFSQMGWQLMSEAQAEALAAQATSTWNAELAKAEEVRRAEAERKAMARRQERATMFNAILSGSLQGLADVAHSNYEDQQREEARLLAASPVAMPRPSTMTRSGTEDAPAQDSPPVATQVATQPTRRIDAGQAAGGVSRPLRILFWMGMMPQAGDTRNPHCTSNIIVRPGPKGWDIPEGTRPLAVYEQARQIKDALEPTFIEKCRAASGRAPSQAPHYIWNADDDDESSMQRELNSPAEWSVQVD